MSYQATSRELAYRLDIDTDSTFAYFILASAGNIDAIAEAFHTRHEELFTYCERDNAVEIMNLESTLVGKVARPQLPPLASGTPDPAHA